MKRFLSDNSKAIYKFVMTHIVMSVLGIMVGLAALAVEGYTVPIIGSIFTIGFMCFMHYDDMYFIGVKEGIKLRSEGGTIDIWKGLKISLISYSPVILIGFLLIISFVITRFTETDNVSAVLLLAYYAVQGSFMCLYDMFQNLFGDFGLIVFVLVSLLPALISASLGYALGLKDKTLRGLMGMNVKPPYDGPMERKPKDKDKNTN